MQRNMRLFSSNKSIASSAAAIVVILSVLWAASLARAQKFELTNEQFDQWVFNGNRDSLSTDAAVSLAVEAVDRICHLNEVQQEKLRLAGRGDFARFQQRVDELRAQYAGKTYDQNDISNIYQKIQPLTTAYRTGLLGPSSLFAKVLHRMLTPEQMEEFKGAEAERLKQHHTAKVRLLVAVLGQSCPLKDDQRSALVELLLAETRPPKRSSQYDWYVVLAQAAKIPNDRFAAILDASQMRCFQKSLARGRALEGFLKQQDILPDP